MDAAGDAIAVWVCTRPNMRLQAAVRPAAAHTWSAPRDVARFPAGAYLRDLRLTVDAAGDAVAVWSRYSVAGAPTYALRSVVQAAVRRAATGTWRAPQTLSAAGSNAALPQVGLDRNGNATAVWLTQCDVAADDGRCVGTVQTAEQPTASGTWTAAEQLSAPGHTASALRLAVDVSGAAVAVWKSDSGFVQVVGRSAATGAWTAPEDVGRTGVMAEPPQVALDGAANATVVYVRGNDRGDSRPIVRDR